MKRTIGILLAVTIFMTLLSGCAAGQNTENTPAPTEAPTATPAPATATPESIPSVTPEPKPEASEVPVESVVSNEGRIYSIEDFFDLPIGRSSAADLIVQNLYGPSEFIKTPRYFGDLVYFTDDPEVTIHLSVELMYDAIFYLSYEHEGLYTYDEDANFEGTFEDVNELGICEVTREERNAVVLDTTYILQDFAWIEPGKTTFEEVCKNTPTEDYFYFYSNQKVLCYPADISGSDFFIYANADDIVYRVVNLWEAENDPKAEAFFTEEYMESKTKILETYLKENGYL